MRAELHHQGLVNPDDLYCIALINGSKLDPATKLNVESMARNASGDNTLTIKTTEEALLRMKGVEEDHVADEVLMCGDEEEDINWNKHHFQKKGDQNNRGFGQRGLAMTRSTSRGYSNYRGRGSCHNCGKFDHFLKYCPEGNGAKRRRGNENLVGFSRFVDDEQDDDESEIFFCDRKGQGNGDLPIIDTGASKSIISERCVKEWILKIFQ